MGLREARLTLVLAGIGVLRLLIAALVPLTPEEAYHWNYARHLDWSYYDHPPMIAWSIAAGRLAFGDTTLGVRFVPVLFSLGSLAIAGHLSRRLYGEGAASWTILLLFIEPVPSLAGSSGFPDSPLLFFWAAALLLTWDAVASGSAIRWIWAGAALGAAMLSKYTAVFFGVSMLGFLLGDPDGRRALKTPWPYAGALAALAVFSPVLLWNASRDWISFRFQSVGRLEQGEGFEPFGGLKYLASQAVAVVPLLLPLLMVAARRASAMRTRPDRYLLWSAAPLLAFFFLVSWKRPVHLMWPMPAYVGLTILMARSLAEGEGAVASFYRRRRAWLIGFSVAALLGAGLHAAFFLPGLSPFPGLYGWEAAAGRARELKTSMPENSFMVGLGRKYTCASQLAFHLQAPFDVHGKNVVGLEGLQYDLWSDLSSLEGKDAVVVLEDGDRSSSTLALLRRHFREVEEAGRIDLSLGRATLLRARPLSFLFFRARGYMKIP
jgi:4-amino-4-deoxy-L-arabinose transferase-like glycosyltransferase